MELREGERVTVCVTDTEGEAEKEEVILLDAVMEAAAQEVGDWVPLTVLVGERLGQLAVSVAVRES